MAAFTGRQGGIAIAGDYLSAASFLGIARRAIAVYGYDGFLYSIGFLVAWLVALLLMVLHRHRPNSPWPACAGLPAQAAAGPTGPQPSPTMTVSSCSTCWPRWPAGGLVALLLNIQGALWSLVIAIVGVLMILYVLIGGMTGTTWVQIIKAVLLITAPGSRR